MTKNSEQPPKQVLVIGRENALPENSDSHTLVATAARLSRNEYRLGVIAFATEYDFSSLQPNEAGSPDGKIASSMIDVANKRRLQLGATGKIIQENQPHSLHGILIAAARSSHFDTLPESEIHVITHKNHWPHVQHAGRLVMPKVVLSHITPDMPAHENQSRDELDRAIAAMYERAIPDAIAGNLDLIEEADEDLKLHFPYNVATMYPGEDGLGQFAREYST